MNTCSESENCYPSPAQQDKIKKDLYEEASSSLDLHPFRQSPNYMQSQLLKLQAKKTPIKEKVPEKPNTESRVLQQDQAKPQLHKYAEKIEDVQQPQEANVQAEVVPKQRDLEQAKPLHVAQSK